MKQLTFDFAPPSRLLEIRQQLLAHFGNFRPPPQRLDPVSQLIRSVLGCRTRDKVSWPTFVNLARSFGSWDKLAQASNEEVLRAISAVEHADNKAVHLLAALRLVKQERESLDLYFLAGLQLAEAQAWLERLPGVGPKVAAAVLNFSSLQMRTFVVDTHVWRVAKRLGLIGPKVSAEKAPEQLMGQIPASWDADDLYELHCLLKALGQDFCSHSRPKCCTCPLNDICKGDGLQGRAGSLRPQPGA